MELHYNPKIEYLFSKYLYHNAFVIEDEQNWKDVYSDLKGPETIEQRFMVQCKKIIDYIKKKETKFTVDSIMQCFFILTELEEKKVNVRKTNTLENLVTMVLNRQDGDIAAESFLYVLQEKLFPRKYNTEMAKIIHNFIQWKMDQIPAIIYSYQTKKIEKLLSSGEYEGALLEMNNIYQRTKHFNIKHKLISFENLKTKILKLKEELYEKYRVVEFYIYGSYAKGTANEYSDLDVYIKVDEKMKSGDLKYDVILYLERKLEIEVDGKLAKYDEKDKDLKIDMIKHLIKIF